MRKLFSYMFKGALLLVPIFLTISIFYWLITTIDSGANDLVENFIDLRFPGLGLLITLVVITVIGMLASTFLFQPIFKFFEDVIISTPLVKIIYTSIKDFFSAFLSEKKRFNQPILVNINGNPNVQRIGFLTQEDLSLLGLEDKVAVYLPHSYNVSGNLYFVSREDVTLLKISPTEAMKFAVSGGVTEFYDPKEPASV